MALKTFKWRCESRASKKAARELLERFGSNVRQIRRKKNWTQEILAETAGINDKEVSHIEQGNRNITLETLVKISMALDIDPHLMLTKMKV